MTTTITTSGTVAPITRSTKAVAAVLAAVAFALIAGLWTARSVTNPNAHIRAQVVSSTTHTYQDTCAKIYCTKTDYPTTVEVAGKTHTVTFDSRLRDGSNVTVTRTLDGWKPEQTMAWQLFAAIISGAIGALIVYLATLWTSMTLKAKNIDYATR